MTIAVYSHKDCLEHDTGSYHPECADRLLVIQKALKVCAFKDKLIFVDAPLGEEEHILLAHTKDYLQYIKDSRPSAGSAYLDGDTVMSCNSWNAVLRAAGAGCQAVDDVIQGKYDHAFCAVRPPGHHATKNHAMGFCIFNNIAIAARYAIKNHGLNRVAIIDFDVHHGNGTEDILAGDGRVLYISTHQSPLFPGTGRRSNGNILNIPLPTGTDGGQYRQIFEQIIMPAVGAAEPELILVSAGFDAHRDDPLAGMKLTEEDYQWIGGQLSMMASKYCLGKTVSFLEGGYNLEVLGDCVTEYLSAFIKNKA